jgi:hypothetical protein
VTAQEEIEFFTEQLGMSQKGMLIGIAKSNIQLVRLNTYQMFVCALMCAMVHWRQGIAPTSWLNRALDDFKKAYKYLADANQLGNVNIPTDLAQMVAFLIDAHHDLPALDVNDTDSADCALDRSLANLLNRRCDESTPVELLKKLGSKKRQSLACKTYTNYYAIIEGSRKGDDIGALITEAEANYKAREKDAFFSGGEQIEGGNGDNDSVVDFRLAVVLKFVGYKSDSIHAWKW